MQVAAAFVILAATRPGQAPPVVIRLAPAELGHVQLRIERTIDGPTHVVLAVERTDTLMLLMQDRPQLDSALTAAGLAPEGRTLQFSLFGGGGGTSGGLGGGPGTGPGSGPGTGGGAGGGGPGGGGFARDQGGGQDSRHSPPPRTTWLRAGIDITA